MRSNRKLKHAAFALMTTVLTSGAVAEETLTTMSLEQAEQHLAGMPVAIQAVVDQTPEVYSFPNTDGEETVNYLGQTFRQVLIQDIKPIAYKMKRAEFSGEEDFAFAVLDSVFRYDRDQPMAHELFLNGDADHRTSAKDTNGVPLGIQEGPWFGDIYGGTTNLKVKLAGVDNAGKDLELLGWASDRVGDIVIDANGDGVKTQEEFMDAMMRTVAKNAADATPEFQKPNGDLDPETVVNAAVSENGLDLAQMMQKFLHGAVSLSQATGDYMSIDLGEGKGLLGNNTEKYKSKAGAIRPFTALEHHWDEAFGYFGAARDYALYLEEEVAGGISLDTFTEVRGVSKDSNGHRPLVYVGLEDSDGEISLRSEKNLGLSVNASKRDRHTMGLTAFKNKIMDSFLKGRQLISEKPEGYLSYVQAYSMVIGSEWEKIIASTALHYINKLEKDYAVYGTTSYTYTALAKHYSELKGFALALQFNDHSPFTEDEFIELHTLIRDEPVVPSGPTGSRSAAVDAYVADLQKARQLLADTYGWIEDAGFTPELIRGW